ncbi:FAD-dependent oxidoreductase [Nocardioides sp. MAH-18]|uniref:FAD-dependent oxidoreductase n=1 Tax=Nocardioides agri TaxID=2682843 RepID=A0A6L6XYW8_9ACTN|nr:FAD-dependent oxidoreductase [Nocardioides sp. CGMCC 1.13656]MBA2952810.1 FAD-dependent oxidoreductase [Nocardioides sp. CGMCC 1.13656]MVQ51972.1 FAD-dependent oxidoreductase [Nocardioides sp. MAH-18]
MADLPSRARVVIVGGGVIGTSVAYHLTRLGWTDVLLLEQGTLSCGTTWHAAGLVGPLRASESGTRLVQYSAELYASLEAETGLATGYRNVGGVVVARTEDRMVQLRRTAANAVAYDLPCELVSPDRAQELWPPMRVDDLLGALWLPGDGKVNPADLTQSLARGARQRGARIVERVRVTGFPIAGGRVTGVHTDAGDVEAEVVVNCGGQWAKALGDLAGVTVPLHSAEHFYVVTEAVPGTHPDLPIMRDPDGWTYFKEETGGLAVGGFEPEAKPWRSPDDLPYPFEFQLLEEDWEHFSVLMEQALLRIPALEQTGIRKFYNGPESFTPDNQFLLGEAPGLRGYFVGAGFNSVGIASAGGAGRALAEWIVAGEPQDDLVAVDVRRFAPFHGDHGWLRSRVSEVLGLHYAVPWPNRELESGRPQRTSPLHATLAERGASFGARMGWERPNVFAPSLDYTWGKPSWLAACAAEQTACRTDVAVFDQTSFSKYEVSGPGALETLQWVCAADVDVPIGRCVYTPFLNHRGTYEADLTVTRSGADSFLLVSSSATTVRDLDWLARHDVPATDVTESYAVLGVMGPRSRALLSSLSADDWSEEGFPFATSRPATVAGTSLRATRMTYVGEVGWELLVPADAALSVYEAVSAAGATDAGYYAIESLRLEKGYRAFGRELTPDYGPAEAGLVFATALKGDKDFLGRAALEEHRAALAAGGARRRLVSLVVESPDPMLWGGELLLRDGVAAGQVTSAAWGETVGSSVGLAYVRHDGPVTADWLAAGGFEVDVAGERHGVRLSLQPPLR